jgi:hypothetical protein
MKLLMPNQLPETYNTPSRVSLTPAFIAAHEGRVETLRRLHRLGVNLNTQNSMGLTPAHAAAATGQVEALSVLHELGADLNRQDQNGLTPMHAAAVMGQTVSERALNRLLMMRFNAQVQNRATSTFFRTGMLMILTAGLYKSALMLGAIEISAVTHKTIMGLLGLAVLSVQRQPMPQRTPRDLSINLTPDEVSVVQKGLPPKVLHDLTETEITPETVANITKSWAHASRTKEDTRCPISLTTPEKQDAIVFEKQYLDVEGEWQPITNTPQTFSLMELTTHFKTKDTHPLTRDAILSPSPHTEGSQTYQTQWRILPSKSTLEEYMQATTNPNRFFPNQGQLAPASTKQQAKDLSVRHP